MGHKDQIDVTDTLVPYGDLACKLSLLESISRFAGISRLCRAGAVSVAMFALLSCSTSPPRAPIAPLGLHQYTIPCRHADSLPKIANHGYWACERYINTCSCVPVSGRPIFGR